MSREWMNELAPEQQAKLAEYLDSITAHGNRTPRKTADELRARKTNRQRHRRAGKKMAKEHQGLNDLEAL
jgi:hypothetical protein